MRESSAPPTERPRLVHSERLAGLKCDASSHAIARARGERGPTSPPRPEQHYSVRPTWLPLVNPLIVDTEPVSCADVEFVRRLQPSPEMDLTELFLRDAPLDDAAAAAARKAAERWFSTDVVCVFHALSHEPRQGIEGWREAWLDWLAPWESYRAEIEEIRDLGDRVAVFVRDYGRPRAMTNEVEFRGVAIYTVREQKVVRVEHFTERSQAAEALGVRD